METLSFREGNGEKKKKKDMYILIFIELLVL